MTILLMLPESNALINAVAVTESLIKIRVKAATHSLTQTAVKPMNSAARNAANAMLHSAFPCLGNITLKPNASRAALTANAITIITLAAGTVLRAVLS